MGGLLMKQKRNLDKLVYKDCKKAMNPALMIYAINSILSGGLTVYTASILGKFTDAVFNLDFSYGISNFLKLAIIIGVNIFVLPISSMIAELSMFRNALRHDRLVYGRFLDKTYESIMKIDAGEVQYHLEQDATDFRCYWVDLWVKFLSIPLTLLYLLYNALQISCLFTVIVFAISSIKLTIPMVIKKIQAKYDKQVREYKTSVRVYETEITKKPHIIKLYGLANCLIKRLDDLYNQYYKTVISKNIKYSTIADCILSFLDTFCILVILFIGATMVSNESITTGTVAAMVGYFSVFNNVFSNMDYIIRKIPILSNLSNRMVVLYDDAEKQSGIEIQKMSTIKADNLSFSYDNKNVITHLNFSINNGEKTVIIGKNGSGKSTLIKLLCGLLKGYRGSLKINGYEFSELSIEKWREQIAYVEQDPYLFEGSVKENILLGNFDATEEIAIKIMDQLGIGYLTDKVISINKKELSGGEKQRVAIARALLKNTDLLILDEPSNNLDKDSITWLRDFVSKSDKTIIYITHDRNIMGFSSAIKL